MNSRRKLFSSLLLMGLVLSLSCGTGHDDNEKYFLISDNIQIPYWQTAGAGLTQAASQLRVWAKFSGPEPTIPRPSSKLFSKRCSRKLPGSWSQSPIGVLKDDIDGAVTAGIPVITVDSSAPASKRLFFIGTDNYARGRTDRRPPPRRRN